jgi:hypothetical protein
MRRALFTLIPLAGLLAASVAVSIATAATVYKWVDENGVVHYSDQPHADAQKVQVEGAQTYKATEAATAAAAPGMPRPPDVAAPPSYQGCALARPTQDQVLLNIDSLTIIVRTDPALHPGDQVYLMMDGQPLNRGAPTGAQFVLTPVDRGAHTLQAVVRNSEGGLQCQTPSVTFHVRQPSVLAPQNPRRPH